MNPVETLAKVADIVDAKGLHSLAEEIEELAQELVQRVEEYDEPEDFSELEVLISETEFMDLLFQAADVLDRKGLRTFANQLDAVIELELTAQDDAIEGILSVYKAIHKVAAKRSLRPKFRTKSLQDKLKSLKEIDYEEPQWKMYRGSPIYPRLFEGFNTINLDRSYYQFRDFGYIG